MKIFSLIKLSTFFVVTFLAISTWFAPNNAFADTLEVQHLDGSWDGKIIPKNGVCLRRGGEGFSPKIGKSNSDPSEFRKDEYKITLSILF